ncbi:hypothetical protein C0992_013248 [Termitomyces sp. T32_za158]|nr:hypothetical protein C0992_013248 [Termitomyces sp. T32_za158]
MERTISSLKKRHNSLCIVERLPKELLATIFKWTLSMERDSRSCDWLRVGRVCTEWLRVALDCPALWCFYRNTNLDWLDIVIRRSGAVPLYVVQNLYRKKSKGFRQALTELNRTRELDFTVYYTKQWETIFDALVKLQCEVPPLLESFKLKAKWQGYEHVPTLPENLFKTPPPRLKTLSLYGCLIGNNTSMLPNLTSLALGQINYEPEENLPIPLAQLMELLKQAPKLEYLELHNACKEDDEVDDIVSHSRNKTVRLSRLQHISLVGPMCHAILPQITHPLPLAHIGLQLDHTSETVHFTHKLFATLVTRIRPIHHLQVVSPYNMRYQCKSWGQENLSIEPPPSVTPDLDLCVENNDDDEVDCSFVHILETMSLASLQVLDIATLPPHTEKLWSVFENLENLTTVRVDDADVVTFLQALKKTYSMKADGNVKSQSRCRARPSFKSLRILILQEWSFNWSIVDKLLKCLAARRRCGAKLQQLNIIKGTFCGPIPTDIVAKLRKNVKDVIWDIQSATSEHQTQSNRDQEDTRSISSAEVPRWDYSSPEENFPFSLVEDDD